MKVEYKIKKNVGANETMKSGILYTKTHANKLTQGKLLRGAWSRGIWSKNPEAPTGITREPVNTNKQGRHTPRESHNHQVVVRLQKFDAQNRSCVIYEWTNEL